MEGPFVGGICSVVSPTSVVAVNTSCRITLIKSWKESLGVYVRRIDPRWVTSAGHDHRKNRRENDWKWEPRVRNLVNNDFFASTEEMFTWQEYADMNERDHMVAWSKLDWLMRIAKGDREAFLASMCTPSSTDGEAGTKAELLARQKRALLAHFGLTPQELDKAWARWVRRTYRKR